MRFGWHKSKSPTVDPGRGFSTTVSRPSTSVSQEYKAALRTNSYAELWSKVQSQLMSSPDVGLLSSVSSRNLFIAHLSETLLEPGRETLSGMIESLGLHRLIIDYFEASAEACDLCELLLVALHQTRANYKRIRRVIELSWRSCDCTSGCMCELISRELGAFSSLRNPLSVVSPVEFHDMNKSYMILLRKLTVKREKVRRKAGLGRLCEQTGRCCFVISCRPIGVVLAIHGVQVSSCCGLGFLSKNKSKHIKDGPCPHPNEPSNRLSSQLDTAAKGLYVLINDMGTMGSLLGRLRDEVEHTREWAGTGANNSKSEKILGEVVRELGSNSLCFMEQLEELEEHIYLCLLTINKSRRSLLQEIMVPSSPRRENGSVVQH